jgi:putative tryptophan/tyrosine transport system substrate-binding protein
LKTIFKQRRRWFLYNAASLATSALLAINAAAAAAAADIYIITADNSDITREILKAISARISFKPLTDALPGDLKRARTTPGIFLAIGSAALQKAIHADLAAPVLSLFTSNEAFHRLLQTVTSDKKRSLITAIYAEASPAHQLRLVQALYKRRIGVAAVLSPATKHVQPSLEQAAEAAGLDLECVVMLPGENLLRTLARLRRSSTLLMLPDRGLYNPETVRNLLESSYRRGQSVIGFSDSLVRVGSLAAAYSTIADTVAQLPPLIDELRKGRIPPAQYPTFWRVAINEGVARSLDLVVDDETRHMGHPAGSK